MVDRFVYSVFAVWTFWGFRSFDSVEDYIEWGVSCVELDEEAGLVTV